MQQLVTSLTHSLSLYLFLGISVPHICMYDCLSVHPSSRQTHWHNNEEGNPRRRRHRLRQQLGRQLHDPQDEIETSCRCPKLVASVLGYGCWPHCRPTHNILVHLYHTHTHTLRPPDARVTQPDDRVTHSAGLPNVFLFYGHLQAELAKRRWLGFVFPDLAWLLGWSSECKVKGLQWATAPLHSWQMSEDSCRTDSKPRKQTAVVSARTESLMGNELLRD